MKLDIWPAPSSDPRASDETANHIDAMDLRLFVFALFLSVSDKGSASPTAEVCDSDWTFP